MRGKTREHLVEGCGQGIPESRLASTWAGRHSHLVLTKAGIRANLTVPQHAELAPGTLRSLIRTAGLSVDGFLNLL